MLSQTNILADRVFLESLETLKLADISSKNGVDVRQPLNFWSKPNSELKELRSHLSIGDKVTLRTLSYKHWKLRKYGTEKLTRLSYLHYGFHRVFSKLSTTKRLYSIFFPKGPFLFSKAEALGRMVYAGFEIESIVDTGEMLEVNLIASEALKRAHKPSTGLIFSMPRVGKGGKMINVYKLRTMHPYSEFLQGYMVKTNGYSKTGKPADDFRVTKWGLTLRKYWLDEVPQLLNILLCQIKIMGVRPVSKTYFDTIPEDLKRKRLRHKPGMIPPYVSLNVGGNVEDVLKAELQYLNDIEAKGLKGELSYLFRALKVILTGRKTSA